MNLASGREVRILDMARQVNDLTGNTAGIVRMQPRVWDTKKRLLASVSRADELLGYQPSMDFDKGLETTIQWFRDNWGDIAANAEFPPGMSSATRPLDDDRDAVVS
jgi:nucleoside-diphosphate-sugar epimerase